jgi:signal peptidase II
MRDAQRNEELWQAVGLSPTSGGPRPRRRRPSIGPLAVGAAVLLVDQLSKEWVLSALPNDEEEGPSWFDHNLYIIHVTNNGAAFGLLAGQMVLFVLIALVVAAVIVAYYRFLPRERLWLRVSLGLQLGGALGNLLDRLRHGYVVDFVEVRSLPVFNVADASIVCGVLILAYYLLVHLDRPALSRRDGAAGGESPPETATPATPAGEGGGGAQGMPPSTP